MKTLIYLKYLVLLTVGAAFITDFFHDTKSRTIIVVFWCMYIIFSILVDFKKIEDKNE